MRFPFPIRLGILAMTLALASSVVAADPSIPSVGKAAPEVTGKDVSGKDLKLSDHKGKVVLVDFWGDW